jgi:Zn-dependent protease with chaperone function
LFRLASLITFGLLIGMVAGVVLSAMVSTGEVNLGVAIVLTIAVNLFIWLISPWLSDLTLRWFNKLTFLDDAVVKERYPGVHQLIHQVAQDYRFTPPRIGLIPDRNPTAFTYGLLRSNARIVVTEGLFEFLSEGEARAVVAHELGHIVNRDFVLMTMAGMLVQILYQVYAAMTRSGSSDKNGKGAIIGVAVLIGYYIGLYLLLYLSRTREYLAAAFSAGRVEPKHLASALVKIAYGIVKVENTEATQGLLRSTRHLGVIDVKNAGPLGLIAESTEQSPGTAAEAMLFDEYNPWAKLVQLNSTHPLTGRRIVHLGRLAKEQGQSIGAYDVAAAAERVQLSRARLRLRFLAELMLLLLPIIAGLVVGLLGAWPLAPAAVAFGVLVTLTRRYPFGTPAAGHRDGADERPRRLAGPGARRASRRQGHRPRQSRIHRRRRFHLPGLDGAHRRRFSLDARVDRQSLRGLHARPQTFRPTGERHRLVPAGHGWICDSPRADPRPPGGSERGRCSGKSCCAFSSLAGPRSFYWLATDRMTVFGRGYGLLPGLPCGSATNRAQPSDRCGVTLTAEGQSSGVMAC